MRHALLATIILVFATVALATAGGAASSTAGRCDAKEATIKGKSVIVSCGPASGTVRYKGKTYRFKSGTCLRTAGSVTLDLGTSLVSDAKGNGGFAHMSITMLSNTLPLQVLADDGSLSIDGSAKFSGIALKGTFTGTVGSFGGVGVGKQVPFSGTWNCGGAIYKS